MSLQFYEAGGTRREVVGLLERVELRGEEILLHVRRKDDTTLVVPLRRVRFGKVVPPRAPRDPRGR